MKLLVFEYRQFKHAQREKTTQACLTKGSLAGCHTRWRGLESPLYKVSVPALSKNCFLYAGWANKKPVRRSGIFFLFLFFTNFIFYKLECTRGESKI